MISRRALLVTFGMTIRNAVVSQSGGAIDDYSIT